MIWDWVSFGCGILFMMIVIFLSKFIGDLIRGHSIGDVRVR